MYAFYLLNMLHPFSTNYDKFVQTDKFIFCTYFPSHFLPILAHKFLNETKGFADKKIFEQP